MYAPHMSNFSTFGDMLVREISTSYQDLSFNNTQMIEFLILFDFIFHKDKKLF